jgi:hypothetical protein
MTKTTTTTRPTIATENVCRIVVKARQFDVKEGAVEENSGSNPSDDGFRGILGAFAGDPSYAEIKSFIDGLDIDEQCDLVALTWVGRGDFTRHEWSRALKLAREQHTRHTAEYLLGMPLLASYLEEGLAAFGESCEGFEKGRL